MSRLDADKLQWVYQRMVLIRCFEDRAAQLFATGKLPGGLHLYAGQEAIAVGVCAHLSDRDCITSTHRGHGHCIAKGVDVGSMMAEIYGKVTGTCKGKGGSMHIADMDRGMLGANGIVGAGGPLACGPALTAKILSTDQVSVCFFGDGAAQQGSMHEAMNLAAIWDLPVIFVCENNRYAESTPISYHSAIDEIATRAAGYNIPGTTVDGSDFFAVHEAAGEAVRRARQGQGPSLVECLSFRFYGHFEGDSMLYTTEQERAHARSRDPIERFRKEMLEHGSLSAESMELVDNQVNQMVEDAVQFAEASPLPAADELTLDVYSRYSATGGR
jgi:pyruvate dehydrogenase E1 component alpha subunit